MEWELSCEGVIAFITFTEEVPASRATWNVRSPSIYFKHHWDLKISLVIVSSSIGVMHPKVVRQVWAWMTGVPCPIRWHGRLLQRTCCQVLPAPTMGFLCSQGPSFSLITPDPSGLIRDWVCTRQSLHPLSWWRVDVSAQFHTLASTWD